MKSLLILTILLMTGCITSGGGEIKFYDKTRTIDIQQAIMEDMIPVAVRLHRMSYISKEDVNIVIDSPGGYVHVGEMFLEAMKKHQENGGKVNCIIIGEAASMALNIYLHCDRLFAMPNTLLQFHAMHVMVQGLYSQFDIRDMYLEAEKQTNAWFEVIGPKLDITMDRYLSLLLANEPIYIEEFIKMFPEANIKIIKNPKLD